MLRFTVDETGRVKVLHVRGEVDITTAPQLHRELTNAVTNSHHVIADLTGVSYLDMSGIRALEAVQQVAHEQGRLLVLVAPPEPIGNVFGIVQLRRAIHIAKSQEEAFKIIKREGPPSSESPP